MLVLQRVGRRTHPLTHLDLDAEGLSSGPRRGRRLTGDGIRTLRVLDVDDPIAHEELLELGERAVRHFRSAFALRANDACLPRRSKALRAEELAGFTELFVEVLHELNVGPEVLGLPLVDLVVAVAARGVHHPLSFLDDHTPSNAACSFARSSFCIRIMACIVRADFALSLSESIPPSCFGTICQDTPN